MPRRLTVTEAADALGITETAVRLRIGRHTLPTERLDGRVYVVLPDARDDTPQAKPPIQIDIPEPASDTSTDTPVESPVQPAQNDALLALERLLRDTLREKDAAQQSAAMWQERGRNLEAEVTRLAGQVEELLSLPAHEEPAIPWWWRFRR